MRLVHWLHSILHPKKLQYPDASLEDVENALKNPVILNRWLMALVDKLQAINLQIDRLLSDEDKDRAWMALSYERRSILRILDMVIEIRNEIESERKADEDRGKMKDKFNPRLFPTAQDFWTQGQSETNQTLDQRKG